MKERPVFGAVLMMLGMLTFPFGDAAVKYLSSDYTAIGLTWARFVIGAIVLVPLSLLFAGRVVRLDRRLVAEQSVRAVLIVAATLLFIVSVSRIPLADAIGAYLIGPLVASALAYFLLGESFSVRRGLAVLVGFSGAMIIVRPGVSMETGYLYALSAGACFGAFLVASRACTRSVHPFAAVAYQTIIGALVLAPFGVSILWEFRVEHAGLLALTGLGSALANVFVVLALTMAPATLLAPLVYVEIIGAAILGYLIFGDVPSLQTTGGIVLIVLAGLVLIERSSESTG